MAETKNTTTVKVDTEKQEIVMSEADKCKAKGWIWDAETKTCNNPNAQKAVEQQTEQTKGPSTMREQLAQEAEREAIRKTEEKERLKREGDPLDRPIGTGIDLTQRPEQSQQEEQGPQSDTIVDFKQDGTIDYTRGGETLNLTKDEYDVVLGKAGMVTDKVKIAQGLQSQAQMQSQQLAGQVGQFGQQSISPTGLDWEQGITEGIIDSIPNSLRLAGGAAVVGATAGLATGGALSIPLAVGGAAVTFAASMASSIISSFKGQRRDTTTAQQRVLDEGKQTMKDWATMAEADPANKARYVAEYNRVSSQINQAYRQMKLDTQRDSAKFETALPNLAEFEAFYAQGGERDVLDIEMRNALTGVSPEGYNMIELANRRGINK